MPWKRHPFREDQFARALSIGDLRSIARRRLPHFIFEYLEGGADDELTLAENREAFARWAFVPNTLVDTSARHHRIELFGSEARAPLVIAPTGMNGVFSRDGDLSLARAAQKAGIPFTLSTVSTTRIEDIGAKVGGRLWMQLYVMKDRAIAESLVRRAQDAGFEALVFTTDANTFGNREWDRSNYIAPGRLKWRHKLDTLRHPRWLSEIVLRHGLPEFVNLAQYLPPGAANAIGGTTVIPSLLRRTLSWEDVDWLRGIWRGKLLIKGVLNVSDAERAVSAGCDGIVLTNHGGRQLDSCVAPLDVLPEIVAAVGKKLTIVIDSGFRRGGDVVKALAFGANAVMLGRATLYGLSAGGEAGAQRALEILTGEIDRTLGHLGVQSISELGPQFLKRAMRR